ncbi:MAG: autotransporter outer membrane beta-barrel domain-containing protein, partial [Herbaspirillum sp.]|uniref:autotransporter outer membrane beta-barrel domain-containing protein n=1 Tax=Herbaspirillum sp. TaxID=1890675 RepID=UPI00258C8D7D
SCDGGHEISDNNAVSVNLASGEDVTCTFTARFDAVDEAMAEETRRFIYRRVDNLLSHGPDRSRLLRRLQTSDQRSSQDDALKFSGSEPVDPGAASVGAAGPLGSVPNSETTLLAAGESGRSSLPYSSGGMTGSVMMSPGPALNDDPVPSAPGALWQFPLHTDDVMGQGALGMPTTGPASSSTALFSMLAGQLTPLGLGQSSSFKFGTSLSEMRAKAAEAEALGYQKKLEDAGLSLSEVSGLPPLQEPRTGFDLWVEGQFSGYTDDIGGINREGDFGVVYVGADYVLAPGVLVGALVQVDDTKEDINGSERTGEIDGTGWMAGPYFGVRLLDNLFFDTRAAWGRSDNDIWLRDEGLGFRNGSFETDRWLATATLTGVYTYDAWRLSPELGLAYGYEAYGTYTNSLYQEVTGGSVNIGRLTGGAELAYSIQMHNGTTIEPMVGIEGIWNFDTDALVIDGVLHQTDESRAKIAGGLLVNMPSGWSLRAAGNYDGLGGGDFQSYGGSLWVNVPFN